MRERFPRPEQPAERAHPAPGVESQPDKLTAVLATLERGVAAALTEEGFAAWLRMLSRFHRYSLANTVLIMAQRPDATLVNSYRRWRQLGRQVRRGETGIKVFYPRKRRLAVETVDKAAAEEEEDAPVVLTGFGVGSVFDITQTDGPPLPAPPRPSAAFATTEAAREVDTRLSLWLLGQGFILERKPTTVGFGPGPRGYFHPPRRIVLADCLPDDDGTAKTLVHEAAHFVAKHHELGEPWEHKPRKELEAEGSAYATLLSFGVDTAAYSIPYLQTWGKTPEAMRAAMPVIAATTRTLIAAIAGERPGGESEWL